MHMRETLRSGRSFATIRHACRRSAHVLLYLGVGCSMTFSLAYEMQRPVIDDHTVIEETLEQCILGR
jgi:hypothetical protein